MQVLRHKKSLRIPSHLPVVGAVVTGAVVTGAVVAGAVVAGTVVVPIVVAAGAVVACAVVARVAIGSLMLNYILASKKRCITPDADIQLPGKFDIDKLCFFITT